MDGVETQTRVEMQDAGRGQPAMRKRTKARPGVARAVAPATQGAIPVPEDMRPEGEHAVDITGNSMMVHVALHHTAEPPGPVHDAGMHLTAQKFFDRLELASKAFSNGLALDGEAFSITGSTADVSKT